MFGAAAPNPDLTVTGVTGPGQRDRVQPRHPHRDGEEHRHDGVGRHDRRLPGRTARTRSTRPSAPSQPAPPRRSRRAIGARAAGSYTIGATADPANTVVEQNESNNAYSNPTKLVVAPVASSDLVPVGQLVPEQPGRRARSSRSPGPSPTTATSPRRAARTA